VESTISGGWRLAGESVQGASHSARGVPNQDAIDWWQADGDLPLILAVADGHGSARSFRSQLGAQLAVATAIDILRNFLLDQSGDLALSVIKGRAEERLARELVRAWRDRVEAHLAENPFTSADLAQLEKSGTKALQAVGANPLLIYGATILSVLVTETYIVYLQLGDGDILTISADAEVARPIVKDSRFLANETTSLCMADAAHEMQIGFEAIVAHAPALILLCTDGYANSFRDDAGFLKIGTDLSEIIRTEGLNAVKANLVGWLNQASQQGSGDDITLGIVCQAAAVAREIPRTASDV
jgi:serine/threonine protein phosphatase PrpC